MEKEALRKLIQVAAGKVAADLVIKNCNLIDVYNCRVIPGMDIAISDEWIAGIGEYQGRREIDARGKYAAPGLMDAHIHIESAYVTPEEFGRLVVPHGTTTVIADPHEIVNVCGMDGLNYMKEASKLTKLDIKFMIPSCVPATPFEHAGADIDSGIIKEVIHDEDILGLGELMNYPGVITAEEEVVNKLILAWKENKIVDGHCPNLSGKELDAYIATRIHTDHECTSVDEMLDRLSRGMYVQLREGSACHDLRTLAKGVTMHNSRRCLLCSDDRQIKTILEHGHMEHHLRICVEEGIHPLVAIQMASLNVAECYHLYDRGAIAPGLRADIVLFEDLAKFRVDQVFLMGEEVACQGKYLPTESKYPIDQVFGRFQVKDFSIEKLRMKLSSNYVNVMDILPAGVLTAKKTAKVVCNDQGEFVFDPSLDIAKIAVIERHQNTGNVALALLGGYGIQLGAIAISIAHDSHNIISVGTCDEDIAFAVKELIAQNGGIILVQGGKIVNTMPMVVGGIMSDKPGEWINEKLKQIHEDAHDKLGISREVDPIMTLSFMALAVIPELKLTDIGLFDVTSYSFIDLEV